MWVHLGMLLGGIFLIKRGKRTLGRSILTVWLLVLAVPAAYLSLAVAALTVQAVLGVSPDRYVAVLAGIAALVIAIFLCIIWGVLKKKKVYVPICVISGILALALGGNAAYDIYQRSIPKISEKDNLLYTYAPYGSGSKVYIPDEEPEIRFTEDIPRMDGATALYPIYSSFARMVYPKEVLEREEYEIYNNEYLQCTKTPQAYENLANGEVDVIFACGPMPMLRAIKKYAIENGSQAFISLEERMACGVGVCLGCVVKTRETDHHSHVKNARICTDGPVYDAMDVEI